MHVFPQTTFVLDADTESVVPTIAYVVRESDGEIRLGYLHGHATNDAEWSRTVDLIENYGGTLLTVIEGEASLVNGEASAWVRQ